MATVKWDHLVHYVNDLSKSIEVFEENGLAAFKGGSHKDWGTYNALSYFGLTYLEFLGIENAELAKASEHNIVVRDAVKALPEHEQLSRVVLRTDDIDQVADTLHAEGLSLSPILDGKRLDNEGRLIEWRMMTIDGEFEGLVYPFIIQWNGTDEERLERLTSTGVIKSHPAGEVDIKRAVFHVSNPAAVANHWGSLFGLAVTELDNHTFSLQIGDKSFVFKQGDGNQLKQIVFETDAPTLKGKSIVLGDGEYVFI